MKEIQALIFDVDGTLADTERDAHLVAFNRAFRDAGLDWEWSSDLYKELLAVTGGKERILHYIENYDPPFTHPADLTGYIADLHAHKTGIYTRIVVSGDMPLRNGVERLLTEAHSSGMRLAIATTTSMENVEALLTHTIGASAMDWFEVIGAGDVVKAKKPAPDIYTYVLEKLGLQPQQCLALEDSSNGIRSTTGAEVPTVITVNEYTRDDDFNGALLVLDQFGEPGDTFTVLGGSAADVARDSDGYVNLELLNRVFSYAT